MEVCESRQWGRSLSEKRDVEDGLGVCFAWCARQSRGKHTNTTTACAARVFANLWFKA
jgi:hypothetical protein